MTFEGEKLETQRGPVSISYNNHPGDIKHALEYQLQREAVIRRAKELAERMGPKWTARVWWNFGWHFQVMSPCGRVDISHDHICMGTMPKPLDKVTFQASVHPKGQGGHWSGWCGKGKTPELAYRRALKNCRAIVQGYIDIVEGL